MRSIPGDAASKDLKSIVEAAVEGPLKVKCGSDSYVVMSEAEYQRLRGEAWAKLFASMDRLAAEAEASGLTEEKLEELLADES